MKAESKKFSMGFPELAMFASNLVVTINRDATPFAARSVTALDITAFHDLGNSFELFPPDDFYIGAIQIEVDAKNLSRDTATEKIQYISGFFEQKWGLDSGEYRQLKIHNLQQMTDDRFQVATRSVVTVATLYIADLTPIGLTQLDVDALATEAQTYEDKMNSVDAAKKLRDDKARERTELGNELYGFVVEYCKIGKLIWENVNEAKYNDYVIYPSTPDMPGKVLNMGYDMPTNTVGWDAAPNADTYQLERKFHTDPDWTVVYEDAATSVVDVPPDPGTWLYRCRGYNADGYGTWSDELTVLMPT